MNKFTNTLLIVQTVFIAVLAIALYFVWHQSKSNGDDLNAYKIAMSNNMKTFTDQNGHLIAQVQAAVFDKDADFKSAIAELNKNGANIQSRIDNNTQGLILLQKKVGGLLTGKTSISGSDTAITKGKTASGRDTTFHTIYPEYAINDTTNKWYRLTGTVGYNSYRLSPLFYDSTELKPTLINGGFFKKSVLGVESLNHSPYAQTTGLKYLTVKKTAAPFWKVLGIIAIFGGGIYAGHKL